MKKLVSIPVESYSPHDDVLPKAAEKIPAGTMVYFEQDANGDFVARRLNPAAPIPNAPMGLNLDEVDEYDEWVKSLSRRLPGVQQIWIVEDDDLPNPPTA